MSRDRTEKNLMLCLFVFYNFGGALKGENFRQSLKASSSSSSHPQQPGFIQCLAAAQRTTATSLSPGECHSPHSLSSKFALITSDFFLRFSADGLIGA